MCRQHEALHLSANQAADQDAIRAPPLSNEQGCCLPWNRATHAHLCVLCTAIHLGHLARARPSTGGGGGTQRAACGVHSQCRDAAGALSLPHATCGAEHALLSVSRSSRPHWLPDASHLRHHSRHVVPLWRRQQRGVRPQAPARGALAGASGAWCRAAGASPPAARRLRPGCTCGRALLPCPSLAPVACADTPPSPPADQP